MCLNGSLSLQQVVNWVPKQDVSASAYGFTQVPVMAEHIQFMSEFTELANDHRVVWRHFPGQTTHMGAYALPKGREAISTELRVEFVHKFVHKCESTFTSSFMIMNKLSKGMAHLGDSCGEGRFTVIHVACI